MNCCGNHNHSDDRQGRQPGASHGEHRQEATANNRTRWWLIGGAVVAVAVILAVRSGNANLLGYGVLLLCPLMHLFMMGSHGKGGHDHSAHRTAEGKENEVNQRRYSG